MNALLLRRRRDERGSILLEALVVVPFFLVLTLGVLDLGMMLRSDIAIANATRTVARVASSSGRAADADLEMLRALGAALANIDGATVNYVTVYKVTGGSSTPPTQCINAAVHGVPNTCNTYSGADLAAVMASPGVRPTSFGSGCTGLDGKWCPTSRVNEQASVNGPDYLGIGVSLTVPTATKLFGSTKTFTDSYVMRLEPAGTSAP